MYKIKNLEPKNMGKNQGEFVAGAYDNDLVFQQLADCVMKQVANMSFESKDDFDEDAFIGLACAELKWELDKVPLTGGFEVEWEKVFQFHNR